MLIHSTKFSHPSLRDMLLIILQDEPKVRRQYILQASPRGLSSLIEGIPFSDDINKQKAHTLVLRDESEINLLCERIIMVITETIPPYMLIGILNSALALLPEKRGKITSPGDTNLMDFSKTPKGKVLKVILDAIAKQETYDNNTTYSLSSWISILEKFYLFAPYMVQIPRPEYISLLAKHLKGARTFDSIYFMELLFKYEPMIFKQIFDTKQKKRWHNSIVSKLNNCKENAKTSLELTYDYDYEDAHAAYDDWYSEAENLLSLAHTFYSFAGINKPKEFFDLEEIFDDASPPPEPEDEDVGDWAAEYGGIDHEKEEEGEEEKLFRSYGGGGERWDVKTLFEDL